MKPTIESIKQLITDAEKNDKLTKLQSAFKEDETFYELEFKDRINIPDEYKAQAIVLPTARELIDTFSDNIAVDNARVTVNKIGIYKTSELAAEMMRKIYMGLIYRWMVESDISPFEVAKKHYALHGITVLKTVYDADLFYSKAPNKTSEDYDKWRDENSTSMPVVMKPIHPANIILDPYYGGRQWVVERHKNLLVDMKRLYPKFSNPNGMSDEEYVEFISYWDKDYRCDMIDGEPIFGVMKHNYGFIPYTVIETGLGNMSIDNDPVKRYVGLLRYVTDMLLSESRDYSLNDVVMATSAMPHGFLEGENSAAVTEIDKKLGAINRLPSGVTYKEVISQMPPSEMMMHLANTSARLAAHGAPNSVRGLPEQGVRSGSDRRLMISQASVRYQYATKAFEHGVAQALIKCARIIKNIVPVDLELWAKTPADEFDVKVDKSLMKEPFTCYVEFSPVSEEDEYRRHDDLLRLYNNGNGLTTKRWSRSRLSNVDPIAMEEQELEEKIRLSPAYQQWFNTVINQRLQETMPQPPPMQSGTVPQSMPETGMSNEGINRNLVPPNSPKPVPGSAEALQNEIKNRMGTNPNAGQQGMGGGGMR
jgi:hypothetical protein